eukprot:3781651-Rhodomonas_salina.4
MGHVGRAGRATLYSPLQTPWPVLECQDTGHKVRCKWSNERWRGKRRGSEGAGAEERLARS